MKTIGDLKRKGISLILHIVFSVGCLAQADSTYIGSFSQDPTLKTFFYYNMFDLLINRPNETKEINYVSNNPMNFGIGVMHPKIPFEISFGYDAGLGADEDHIATKSFDFQLHKYGRMYVADFFVQNYEGFYLDDPSLAFDKADRPDLSVFHMGLIGQYVFNGKKFSYRAAFDQSELQIRSLGSFLLGGAAYYFDINSDTSLVFSDKRKIKSYQFGLNIGYSYNWVIKKHWLINSSLTLGANLGNSGIEKFFNKELHMSPMSLVRLSFLYNDENWSLGVFGVANLVGLMYTKNLESDVTFGRFNVMYIRRFNLKKRGKI